MNDKEEYTVTPNVKQHGILEYISNDFNELHDSYLTRKELEILAGKNVR